MKHLHHFLSTLAPNDIVNVVVDVDAATGMLDERRARLCERTEAGFLAEVEGRDALVPVTRKT